MQYGTAKDANIKTWADLKGTRVADVEGYPALTLIAEGCLAFGGLTWDDVERVMFPSFGTAGKGVIEGKVDSACCATYSSWVYELESSPRGLYFPPYPHADKEAWARLRLKNPVMVPIKATVGPGLSADNPLETGSYPNPSVLTYDRIEPEFAYQMAKLLYELWPVYGQAKAPGIEQFDPKNHVYDYVIPYHEGAVKYYKEIGVWTAEHDKNNASLVKRQQVLAEAWDKAVAQGAAEGVKSGDFPAFWEVIRVKALEDAGFDVYYKK
jgi:TRAP transporter TAXI family solute receptor